MNLRLFDHPDFIPSSPHLARRRDKLNTYTGLNTCDILESTGWYNQTVSVRLLGHYRLFQNFKKNHRATNKMLPIVRSYVLHYQATYKRRHIWLLLGTIYYGLRVVEILSPTEETRTYNDLLLNEAYIVLEKFLLSADKDFDKAIIDAHEQLSNPIFFGGIPDKPKSEIHFHSVIKEGPVGKEKGVFSKKQALIIFDLLSETTKLEKIDLSHPNKFDAIAELFHAMTGKSKESFIKELNAYKNKDLYSAGTPGELAELIKTLTNLSNLFGKAGFRSIAKLADAKIRELEKKKGEL